MISIGTGKPGMLLIRRVRHQCLHLLLQVRQITLYGLPDNAQIYFEVAMGQRVAHLIGECKR